MTVEKGTEKPLGSLPLKTSFSDIFFSKTFSRLMLYLSYFSSCWEKNFQPPWVKPWKVCLAHSPWSTGSKAGWNDREASQSRKSPWWTGDGRAARKQKLFLALLCHPTCWGQVALTPSVLVPLSLVLHGESIPAPHTADPATSEKPCLWPHDHIWGTSKHKL